MMTGIKYRISIAINGVISNMPSLGIIRLNGERIDSVTSSSKMTNLLYLLTLNHDIITLAKIM